VTTGYGSAAAYVTAAALREKAGDLRPDVGIILGSGLGGLADNIESGNRVPFRDVPGFPSATVAGHAGALVAGQLGGKSVVALAGRFHMYAGHTAAVAAFPVRVMHALGARTLIASNAAGAIRDDLAPGDLMIIEDHINLTFTNPLTGPVQEGDERFPDMSHPYDAELRYLLSKVAEREKIQLKSGVYACLPGPSFETRAEVRMLARLGADAVGMSTVPEVIVARTLRMRVAAVSCITNAASGTAEGPVLHQEVLDVTARAADRFQRLIQSFIAELPRTK
jgi:purine-nucleoside phosphorylase